MNLFDKEIYTFADIQYLIDNEVEEYLLCLLSVGPCRIMGKHRMVDSGNIVLSFRFIMKVT